MCCFDIPSLAGAPPAGYDMQVCILGRTVMEERTHLRACEMARHMLSPHMGPMVRQRLHIHSSRLRTAGEAYSMPSYSDPYSSYNTGATH
eukprot:809334-Amphidinium_carterae.1